MISLNNFSIDMFNMNIPPFDDNNSEDSQSVISRSRSRLDQPANRI